MTRKSIHTYVRPEVWEQFLHFVISKHGKIKGVLGTELESALLCYMQSQSPLESAPPAPEQAPEQKSAQVAQVTLMPENGNGITYINTHNPKVKQKLQQLNKLITVIRALGPGARVSQKLLEKKMVETLGILTPPTRQAYLQNLVLLGVLEPDGDGFYHVI